VIEVSPSLRNACDTQRPTPQYHPIKSTPTPHHPQLSTVGYGDISARNTGEMLFSVAAILVGVSAFAYTAGMASVLLADMTTGGEGVWGWLGGVGWMGCSDGFGLWWRGVGVIRRCIPVSYQHPNQPISMQQQHPETCNPKGDAEIAERLRHADAMMRARGVPLRLSMRVRAYLGFVLRRQVSREQAELVNGEWSVRSVFERVAPCSPPANQLMPTAHNQTHLMPTAHHNQSNQPTNQPSRAVGPPAHRAAAVAPPGRPGARPLFGGRQGPRAGC
jgi:hypothetical protein